MYLLHFINTFKKMNLLINNLFYLNIKISYWKTKKGFQAQFGNHLFSEQKDKVFYHCVL